MVPNVIGGMKAWAILSQHFVSCSKFRRPVSYSNTGFISYEEKCLPAQFGSRPFSKAGTSSIKQNQLSITSNQRGFTLIEVLVALIIIAIACFAVLHIVSSSINMNRRLETHMVGTWVSQNVLADLRSQAITIPDDTKTIDDQTTMLYQNWLWHVTLLDQDGFIGHYDQAVGISVKSPLPPNKIIWRLHGYIPLKDGSNGS